MLLRIVTFLILPKVIPFLQCFLHFFSIRSMVLSGQAIGHCSRHVDLICLAVPTGKTEDESGIRGS